MRGWTPSSGAGTCNKVKAAHRGRSGRGQGGPRSAARRSPGVRLTEGVQVADVPVRAPRPRPHPRAAPVARLGQQLRGGSAHRDIHVRRLRAKLGAAFPLEMRERYKLRIDPVTETAPPPELRGWPGGDSIGSAVEQLAVGGDLDFHHFLSPSWNSILVHGLAALHVALDFRDPAGADLALNGGLDGPRELVEGEVIAGEGEVRGDQQGGENGERREPLHDAVTVRPAAFFGKGAAKRQPNDPAARP